MSKIDSIWEQLPPAAKLLAAMAGIASTFGIIAMSALAYFGDSLFVTRAEFRPVAENVERQGRGFLILSLQVANTQIVALRNQIADIESESAKDYEGAFNAWQLEQDRRQRYFELRDMLRRQEIDRDRIEGALREQRP